jgi:ABC-type dipeptide/oligopeptide/nickel transport system ATPase component
MAVLLEVKNLETQFKTEAGLVKAVDGISYHINEHEIVGVVGESGCGKSPVERYGLKGKICLSSPRMVRR